MFVGALTTNVKTKIKPNECFVTLEVQGTKIRFKVDTGSQANIMPASKLEQLKLRPQVQKTSTRRISYTGEDLPICGQCTLQCQNRNLDFFRCGYSTRTCPKFPNLSRFGYCQDYPQCGHHSKLQSQVCKSVQRIRMFQQAISYQSG